MIIDAEFKALIPALTKDEFSQLEENILRDGIQDPLKIWNGTLIDGHNRYEIAQRHGLTFSTTEMNFSSRDDVIVWIIKNQFGRRNLSAYDRSLLALRLKPILAAKAKEKQAEYHGNQYESGLIQKSGEQHRIARAKQIIDEIKSNNYPKFVEDLMLETVPRQVSTAIRNEIQAKNTHIYFMRIDDKLKVGSSYDVEDRLKQLKVASPTIEIVGDVLFGEGARTHENILKKKFAKFLIGGEVYKYSDELLEKMLDYTEQESRRCKQTGAVIAKMAGVSRDTIAKVEKIEQSATPEIKAALKSGNMSINTAYREVKKAERNEEIQRQVEEIEQKAIEKPDGLFDVIVIDPPWNYGDVHLYHVDGWRVSAPYPEMSQEELKKIELPAADNCVLCIWTPNQFIWDAKDLMDNWGFQYRFMFIWNKQKMGVGRRIRMQCEFCIVGLKGNPVFKDVHDIRDIIEEPRREHSRKPEKFYQIIDSLFAGRKLDYFSREQREGWFSYGNDTSKF